MKMTVTLNEDDIVGEVRELFARKKLSVKAHSFDVEQRRNAFDQPTGFYTVTLKLELEDDLSSSQR